MEVEDILTKAQNLIYQGRREEPERLLLDLMEQMGTEKLSEYQVDLEKLFSQFQKKRQKNLKHRLTERTEQYLANSETTAEKNRISEPVESVTQSKANFSSPNLEKFSMDLDILRQHHIFQWSTFYKNCFDNHFDQILETKFSSHVYFYPKISELLFEHTKSVFAQGYEHAVQHGKDHAIRKSIAGLAQFLALQLDFYSLRSSSASDYDSANGLRALFSAAVSGILKGYGAVQFGNELGIALLPRYQRQWVHYLTFLTPQNASDVIDSIESGWLQDTLTSSLLPLLDCLQSFFNQKDGDYWPLPVVGRYDWNQRRFDVSCRPPQSAATQRLIQLCAFLDESFLSIEGLEDAGGRQAVLIMAPLRPDMNQIVEENERLKSIVIPLKKNTSDQNIAIQGRRGAARQAFGILQETLYQLRSKLNSKAPITYNFAKEFPLGQPEQANYFRVTRFSVRDLLRTFERRNGVRLWCSIRRSGKSMACQDMETSSKESKTVLQTCGVSTNSPSAQNLSIFYERLRSAIDSRQMVPKTFVQDLVAQCAQGDISDRRAVLIIDEYETLFALLKNAALNDNSIRYTTVQPILDQLVEFSKENLLVLLGQQPDAHFILMDQNQLAPYVTQDSFPLFEHVPGVAISEFAALVEKVLLGRVNCTPGFLNLLYSETSGHPYLTVNVLVEFIELLIDRKRPRLDLQIREEDFELFSVSRLNSNRIMLCDSYSFFRQAASAALSTQCYRNNPWLFSVYWIIRLLTEESPLTFAIDRNDFDALIHRIPVPSRSELVDSAEILRSASYSNFIDYDEKEIRVKIRTLGRIAAAVRPQVA